MPGPPDEKDRARSPCEKDEVLLASGARPTDRVSTTD
jgi:hypothetical protein